MLSLQTLLFSFPVPIVFALLLNQVRHARTKKFIQTVSYAPYFISNVVVVGMMTVILSPGSGFVNTLITSLGLEPVLFMTRPEYFRPIYILSNIWQYMGFNLIGRFDGAREHSLPDTIWECPVVMIDRQGAVLFISAPFTVRTFTGRYQGGKLRDCAVGFADLGDCLYAPNLVRHPDGRWILFGWERECGGESERAAQGWQGMISLPREISVREGRLETRPAAELQRLRQSHLLHVEARDAAVEAEPGQHCEIEASLDFGSGGHVCLELLRDEEGKSVEVVFDGNLITILRGDCAGGAKKELCAKVLPMEKSKLQIYLDGTSVEIFINARETLTTRVYPNQQNTGFRARAEGGCAIDTLDVYVLASCY